MESNFEGTDACWSSPSGKLLAAIHRKGATTDLGIFNSDQFKLERVCEIDSRSQIAWSARERLLAVTLPRGSGSSIACIDHAGRVVRTLRLRVSVLGMCWADDRNLLCIFAGQMCGHLSRPGCGTVNIDSGRLSRLDIIPEVHRLLPADGKILFMMAANQDSFCHVFMVPRYAGHFEILIHDINNKKLYVLDTASSFDLKVSPDLQKIVYVKEGDDRELQKSADRESNLLIAEMVGNSFEFLTIRLPGHISAFSWRSSSQILCSVKVSEKRWDVFLVDITISEVEYLFSSDSAVSSIGACHEGPAVFLVSAGKFRLYLRNSADTWEQHTITYDQNDDKKTTCNDIGNE